MHVISRRALRGFWSVHPPAEGPLAAWFRLMERNRFADLNALRQTFPAADYVAPYTVFNVGGNKYRVIVSIVYAKGLVYVIEVFTHAEYNRWSTAHRKGKPPRKPK